MVAAVKQRTSIDVTVDDWKSRLADVTGTKLALALHQIVREASKPKLSSISEAALKRVVENASKRQRLLRTARISLTDLRKQVRAYVRTWNRPFTQSHLEALGRITDAARMKLVLNQCVTEGLSVDALQKVAVNDQTNRPRRPGVMSKQLDRQVEALTVTLDQVVNNEFKAACLGSRKREKQMVIKAITDASEKLGALFIRLEKDVKTVNEIVTTLKAPSVHVRLGGK